MIEEHMLDNLTGEEIKAMINAEEISIEDLNASALQKLMNYEIDMLCVGEGDVDLVCRCSNLLEEIEPCPISNEEFMAIVKKTREERIVIVGDESKFIKSTKKRFILKRIAIIAAAFLILSVTTVGVANTLGFDIGEEINKIIRQGDGARKDIDGFTFYNGFESQYYSSVKELMEKENLELMSPTKLPDGVNIETIQMFQLNDKKNSIQIYTNDVVTITIEPSDNKIVTNNANAVEYDGITYYIQNSGDLWVAGCYHNGNLYSFIAKTKDDLILIIENMKEFEK